MVLTKYIPVILLITVTVITATKDQNVERTADAANKENFNPLGSLVLNQNEVPSTKDGSGRVKRQYYPNSYGRGSNNPIPIFLGGGGGRSGFGQAYGGSGFGGRGGGFGGRGAGRGGGFGGRGGGFGGRGGAGGGRGGGRG